MPDFYDLKMKEIYFGNSRFWFGLYSSRKYLPEKLPFVPFTTDDYTEQRWQRWPWEWEGVGIPIPAIPRNIGNENGNFHRDEIPTISGNIG